MSVRVFRRVEAQAVARTSRKSAKGLVRRGQACWVDDNTILMTAPRAPRHDACYMPNFVLIEQRPGDHYCVDHGLIATRRQIRRVPVLRIDELLAPVTGRQRWAWRSPIQIKLSQYPASE